MPQAVEGTKRIFVSDLHMGDERSLHPPNKLNRYGWLHDDRAGMFADFLQQIGDDLTVNQLIIVGDLFDEWVCPTELDPVTPPKPGWNQFCRIAEAPQNKRIIHELWKFALSGRDLIYVPGNHDMLIDRVTLQRIIPKIQCIIESDAPGKGVFKADGIVAEHGSMYCLFNAPDTQSVTGHSLPLGFFMARVATEVVAKSPVSPRFLQEFVDHFGEVPHHPGYADAVFRAMLGAAQQSDVGAEWLQIVMGGINGYSRPLDPLWVLEHFGNRFETWPPTEMPDNVPNWEAVLGDLGDLWPAAVHQYFHKQDGPNIVIFGHTHQWELRGSRSAPGRSEEKEQGSAPWQGSKNPSTHIYANCGTWINAKPKCTFVETELRDGCHYVRVKEYTKDGINPNPLRERFTKQSQ